RWLKELKDELAFLHIAKVIGDRIFVRHTCHGHELIVDSTLELTMETLCSTWVMNVCRNTIPITVDDFRIFGSGLFVNEGLIGD
ncbi:unnamed protein product, partial [Arabidopsis halleri]